MRILQLGKFYPIKGGVEKVMWDITYGLSEKGIDCDMLCACLNEELPEDAMDASEVTGCKGSRVITFNGHGHVFCVKASHKVAATMMSPDLVTAMRRMCRQYDIVHIHHPDPMAAVALMFSGFKGKVVLHWHSDILSQKGLLTLYKPIQSWLINRADKIVGTTPVYVRESPYLRYVQNKVGHIPIGVHEIARDYTGAERLRARFPGKKIVYSLGRLVPYKGYSYLIDAAKYLPDNYQIVIGGGGPLKDELQAQIDNDGFSDKVTLLGFVPDSDIAAWFRACDLFCLSSVWKTEAFAIVQIEAMSCGKPVVATEIPESGVSWVNAHGISGLNVPPGNSKAIAEAILKLTADSVYGKYCMKALGRYSRYFTYGQMIDNCLKLYSSIL